MISEPRNPSPGDARRRVARAGFSLIEALVVLAITAITFSLLFSMGGRGVEAGFRIGRSALSQADQTIAVETLRTLFQDLILIPEGLILDEVTPPEGGPEALSAMVRLSRPSPCGPGGSQARLHLRIERDDDGAAVVTCALDDQEPVELFSREGSLALSYSADGATWGDAIPEGGEVDEIRERRLYIRLAQSPGGFEVVGRSSSGRPQIALEGLEP